MAWTIDDLETPAVLVDLDKVEANLRRAQAYADEHGLRLRPHIKTHKIPAFARRQMALGAVGITCQKIGEAEVMADAGLDDILIAYNITGGRKLDRLAALAKRVTLAVTVDDPALVAPLGAAMRAAGAALGVLIECDTGAERCGVQAPEDTVALARAVEAAQGLAFRGLMTYPPQGRPAAVGAWLAEARAALADAGLDCPVVSTGGTPDMLAAADYGVATEHRPGTYIYGDRFQAQAGWGGLDDCALRVLTTVASRPTDGRAILDAGSKTLSSDTLGLDGYGHVVEYPQLVIARFSEEHGHVDCSAANARPKLGERVTVIPNHACVVTNLVDRVYGVRGEQVETAFEVAARGRLT